MYKVTRNHDFGRHLGCHLEFLQEPKLESRGLLVCYYRVVSKHILKNSAQYSKCPCETLILLDYEFNYLKVFYKVLCT